MEYRLALNLNLKLFLILLPNHNVTYLFNSKIGSALGPSLNIRSTTERLGYETAEKLIVNGVTVLLVY